MAEALPQLLSQLGTWAESREMAREDAGEANELLDIAAQHADKLARLLETAQSSTAHLYHAENAAIE